MYGNYLHVIRMWTVSTLVNIEQILLLRTTLFKNPTGELPIISIKLWVGIISRWRNIKIRILNRRRNTRRSRTRKWLIRRRALVSYWRIKARIRHIHRRPIPPAAVMRAFRLWSWGVHRNTLMNVKTLATIVELHTFVYGVKFKTRTTY